MCFSSIRIIFTFWHHFLFDNFFPPPSSRSQSLSSHLHDHPATAEFKLIFHFHVATDTSSSSSLPYYTVSAWAHIYIKRKSQRILVNVNYWKRSKRRVGVAVNGIMIVAREPKRWQQRRREKKENLFTENPLKFFFLIFIRKTIHGQQWDFVFGSEKAILKLHNCELVATDDVIPIFFRLVIDIVDRDDIVCCFVLWCQYHSLKSYKVKLGVICLSRNAEEGIESENTHEKKKHFEYRRIGFVEVYKY